MNSRGEDTVQSIIFLVAWSCSQFPERFDKYLIFMHQVALGFRWGLSTFPDPSWLSDFHQTHVVWVSSVPCFCPISLYAVCLEILLCSTNRAKFRGYTSLPVWEPSNFICSKEKRQYSSCLLKSTYWSSLPNLLPPRHHMFIFFVYFYNQQQVNNTTRYKSIWFNWWWRQNIPMAYPAQSM